MLVRQCKHEDIEAALGKDGPRRLVARCPENKPGCYGKRIEYDKKTTQLTTACPHDKRVTQLVAFLSATQTTLDQLFWVTCECECGCKSVGIKDPELHSDWCGIWEAEKDLAAMMTMMPVDIHVEFKVLKNEDGSGWEFAKMQEALYSHIFSAFKIPKDLLIKSPPSALSASGSMGESVVSKLAGLQKATGIIEAAVLKSRR
jgi:hypothetical protein